MTEWFDVYAPLREFRWDGNFIELSPGLQIKRFEQTPDLRGLEHKLSDFERNALSLADHWLIFRWFEGAEPKPAETVNLVLLSLWLVKPIRAHVEFRFELCDRAENDGSRATRLLDRFQWISSDAHDPIDDADLQSAAKYYTPFFDLRRNHGRLNDAVVLTLAGCMARRWQVAFVCYAAAAETLLTYSEKRGLTKRLATAYACLVESQPDARDVAFEKFKELYSIRSDIVHGRGHNVQATDRLPYLSEFEEMLRKLWREVVSSPALMAELEGQDSQRKAYFGAKCLGYSPH